MKLKLPKVGYAKFANIKQKDKGGFTALFRVMKRTLTFIVPKEFNGFRTDTALREKWGISGSLLKDLKKYPDGIMLNGVHIRTIDTICSGDVLEVNIYDTKSKGIIPENIPLDIMYEDEDILIINKASGLPTHPSMGHYTGTVANAVMAHYDAIGEEHTFRAVNRLDKDTSGVMCIAKNGYAHAKLADDLINHELRRKYTAIAEGTISMGGIVDKPIARLNFIKRGVDSAGQHAVTHYKPLKRYNGYTLTELQLETGRTHQIRVHMSYIGHPLLGDWLYGTEDKELFPRQALHSSYLRLIHPTTGKKMIFEPPLAKDMENFLKQRNPL